VMLSYVAFVVDFFKIIWFKNIEKFGKE